MLFEYKIKCDEPKIFDHALSDQKTIEWIARRWLWFDDGLDMPFIDNEQPDTHAVQEVRKLTEFEAKQTLAVFVP
jgi:hypothetical protein